MKKKKFKKVIIPLAVTTSLFSTQAIINSETNNIAVASEENKISNGFSITAPYIEDNAVKFNISAAEGNSVIFSKYWSKVTKVLLDGKDFGFNNKGTYSSTYYALNDGVVTTNASGALEHFQKQTKHKIEFIFEDGSSSVYVDEGYIPPTTTTDNVDENKINYEIASATIESNWDNTTKYLTLQLTDKTKNIEFFDQIKDISINGTALTLDQIKSGTASRWFGIRFEDAAIRDLMKDTANVINITLQDGTQINFPKEEVQTNTESNTENTSNTEDNNSVVTPPNDENIISDVTLDENYKEVHFIPEKNINTRDLYKKTKSITINNVEFDINNFAPKWNGNIYSLGIGEAEKIFTTWKKDGKNTVVFNYTDGTSSKTYEFGEDKKVEEETKTYTLTDKLEDGVYTLGFNALYADGREGTSMLEGFFDKNVKLEVKDGKMKITMLNLLFGYSLYDFAIENNGTLSSATKEFYGSQNSAGQYEQATFTMDITDLDQIHLAAVLVGHMGGLQSQIGDFDKYTKVKLKFKPEIKKGWTDFNKVIAEKEERAKSDSLLQKKLIANGVDTNKDGIVTAEELYNFSGEINIGSILIDDAVDMGKIYNIELLKNMGPGVTTFKSDSNQLGELPEDLFAKAVNIEKIYLGGNQITNIPENIFANNTKLKTLSLSSNKLVSLPDNLLKNNTELLELSLEQSWLNNVPANLIANLTKLESLSLSENNISSIDDNFFQNNNKLTFIGLANNKLEKLPSSIGKVISLKKLAVTNNNLTSIPAEIANANSLNTLYANYNNLTSLSNELWARLAKNNGSVYLVNNEFTEIPVNIIKENGKLNILDISNNNLPANIPYTSEELQALAIKPENIQAYYPQRTATSLNILATNNEVSVEPSGDLTILNLLHWFHGRSKYFGGEGIIQGTDLYTEFIKNLDKPIDETLLKEPYNRNWKINTQIERIRNGESTIIYNETTSNTNDSKIKINDENMQDGDIYKVTKTLYEKTAVEDSKKIVTLTSNTVAKKTPEKENTTNSGYNISVAMKQAADPSKQSMGHGAIEHTAYVEENNDSRIITLTFKPMYIAAFNATGHVTKTSVYSSLSDIGDVTKLNNVEVVETYEENGIKFPKKVRFTIPKEENQVGIRVSVDMMDALAPNGDGSQNAILEFDWSTKPTTTTPGNNDNNSAVEENNNTNSNNSAVEENNSTNNNNSSVEENNSTNNNNSAVEENNSTNSNNSAVEENNNTNSNNSAVEENNNTNNNNSAVEENNSTNSNNSSVEENTNTNDNSSNTGNSNTNNNTSNVIEKNDNNTVSITTNNTTVTSKNLLGNEILTVSKVSEDDEKTLISKIANAYSNNLYDIFDITIKNSDGTEKVYKDNEQYDVKIKVDKLVEKLYYLNEQTNNLEEISFEQNGEYITFTVSHFSKYVIKYANTNIVLSQTENKTQPNDESKNQEINTNSPSKNNSSILPKTGITTTTSLVGLAILGLAITLIRKRKL